METDTFVYLPVPSYHKLEPGSKEHGTDYPDPPNFEAHIPPDVSPKEHSEGEEFAPWGNKAYAGIDEHLNVKKEAAEKPCVPIDYHTCHTESPGK